MKFLRGTIPGPLALLFLCATSSAGAAVIYSDDFSGTGDLNGTAPDDRPGTETWTAKTGTGGFTLGSGVVTRSADADGSATLPFTLVAGNIYTLSVTMTLTAASTSSHWFALGFYNNVGPTAAPISAAGGSGPTVILRYNIAAADPVIFFPEGDTDTGGRVNLTAAPDGRTNVDMVLTLDTTATNWTVGLSLDGVQKDLNGAGAGLLYTYTANPTINQVGISGAGTAAGTFDNFVLSAVPEPSVVAFLIVGSMVMAASSRRRLPRTANHF